MIKESKICTIGGGNGMPVVNQALVIGGFKNISSIVTTFDNGGDTGRIRTDERGQVLAFSDYWRALISLWKDGEQKEVWEEMLRYRDGRGRNFGNSFFQFMSERSGSLSRVDELFRKLTLAEIEGRVIPVSLSPSEVCFETINKKKYCGEKYLDELRMSEDYVKKIWLEPPVNANREAIEAIDKAEVIIVGPGSLYGSLMTNFLPKGLKEAYQKSKARKVLIVNMMTSANDGKFKNQLEYSKIFENYLKSKFDCLMMADLECLDKKILKKVIHFYELEGSKLVKIAKDDRTIIGDIATIDEKNWRLRHSQSKLADFFVKMDLCRKKN